MEHQDQLLEDILQEAEEAEVTTLEVVLEDLEQALAVLEQHHPQVVVALEQAMLQQHHQELPILAVAEALEDLMVLHTAMAVLVVQV
jgi:hypothetical protein